MAKMIFKERKTPVLTKVVLPCITDYYNINITGGCMSGCVYCYAQGYSSNPKNGTVTFYCNSFEKLECELARKRTRPKIVYFSSASEPFTPFGPALNETYKTMDLLMKAGINIFISTKSWIPEKFIRLFSRHPESVRVQIGITTADDEVRKVLEPHAAPVNLRLKNIERLEAAGIVTEARLDPLVPGITDQDQSLAQLFPSLANAGIKTAIATYLFLRASNRNRVRNVYGRFGMQMERFYEGDAINYCRGGEVDIAPKKYRAEKYESIIALAKESGITIILCHCRNPDLTEQSCHPQADDFHVEKQLTLFQI